MAAHQQEEPAGACSGLVQEGTLDAAAPALQGTSSSSCR